MTSSPPISTPPTDTKLTTDSFQLLVWPSHPAIGTTRKLLITGSDGIQRELDLNQCQLELTLLDGNLVKVTITKAKP